MGYPPGSPDRIRWTITRGIQYFLMYEDVTNESEQDLLDLNEIMWAFGVETWTNLGPMEHPHNALLQIQVEIEGRRYLLKEQPEGLAEQGSEHLYAFHRYLP